MSFLTQIRVFFLLLFTSLSFSAFANPFAGLTYGVYSDLRIQVRVLNHEIIQKSSSMGMSLHQYRVEGDTIKLVSFGQLVDSKLNVSVDGKTITDLMFKFVYPLKQEQPCLTNIPEPKTEVGKTCWNDMKACHDKLYGLDTAQLKQLCEDYIEAACSSWEARTSAEKSGQSLYGAITAIPAAPVQEYTDTMANLCRSGISGDLCENAARAQWLSGQYLAARDTLQVACSSPINDSSACEYVANFAALTEQDIASPAPGIPSGAFARRETGNPDFTIAEDGTVEMDGIAPVKAQEEKGIIRIRHNKGGDFAFRRAGKDKLIGLDFWNQLKVYHLRHDGE
ncbi:MAG: hypothetical protein ACMZI0_04855 [Symbiopectobacterium sp.]|uniref:hypothetical protein n=1 Tax=Symbiopectobacterium sp. TaxID=2952789 RepID=UPI0039EAF927